MNRLFKLGLVLSFTIVSVFVMLSVDKGNIVVEPVFLEDESNDYGKPEGTGYLFDDFDRGINIPFEGGVKDEEVDENNNSSQQRVEKRRVAANEYRRVYEDGKKSSSATVRKSTAIYKVRDIRSESKAIISKVQNNITLEDKLHLLKIVKNLSLKDLNDIKNAIFNGTTNSESIKLWTMLRNKLPEEEYNRLESIISKYE